MESHLQRAPFGVLTVDADGIVTGVNEAAASLLDVSPDAVVGADLATAMPTSFGGNTPETFVDPLPSETTFEEFYPGIERWLAVDIVPDGERTTVYLRDRTDARECENELDRLRRRLESTEEVDALTARTLRTVIDADDSDAVARTVCEGLGTADHYEFAWVGEVDPTGEGLRAVASAGGAPELVDRLHRHLDEPPAAGPDDADPDVGIGSGDAAVDGDVDPSPTLLEWQAIRSGATVTTDALAADESLPDDVRTAAFGRGLQSAAAVPLAYGGTTFGVLGVYLSRERGVADPEQSSLETLGAVAGHAITASRREDLLFADTVTELTLRVDDDTLPLPTAARTGGTTLSIAGVVPRSGGDGQADDGLPQDAGAVAPASDPGRDISSAHGGTASDEAAICYVQTEGEVEPIVTALQAHDQAVDPRVIDDEGRSLLEVTLVGGTPPTVLSNWGATVRTGTVDSGGYQLSVTVSTDVAPRRLLEAVDAVAAETAVRSKTEEPRTVRTAEGFQSDLEAMLTDRQRTVLRTAYLSEYFTSPRGSTAEEVAAALDITGPTVLYHLRRAQRKLLDAFFADEDAVDSS
jgi:hypothetical protein